MDASKILESLKEICPNICVTVDREEDHYYSWDGDGNDPRDDGFQPYDVSVKATAIYKGNAISGVANMGGHYQKPDEFELDLGGYLPQMIEEALEELQEQTHGKIDASKALSFIKNELHERYESQRANVRA